MRAIRNSTWFPSAILFCFCFAHTASSEVQPTVDDVLNSIIQAVKDDDNAAYRAARSVALRLDDREFDALLEVLDKTETWQALAVKNGLRVRRKNPKLAAEFDESLDWLRSNPWLARDGTHIFPVREFGKKFNTYTSESDWLRYEAVLTEKAELPPDESGFGRQLPVWITFRRFVFGPGALHANDMRFRIMMLRDMPEWISYGPVLSRLPGSIRRSPDRVDMYVPELVEHYKRMRQAYGDLKLHATSSIFLRLMEAIAEADTDIALPALKGIREFEQTTGEKIEKSRDDRLQARLQEIEELSQQALREGREEDARKLTMERPRLRRARRRNIAPAVRRKLDELIEKHREDGEK